MSNVVTIGGPSPFRFPAIWDSLSLGGGAFTWSGRVDFVGARRAFDWQFKKPPGVKGDINTFRGTHCNSFQMRIYVWTEAQWELLPGLLSYFQYDGSKLGPDGLPLVNAVDIYHPALSYLDITQVICEEIFAPEVDKERSGAVWLAFKLHEYLPAIPTRNVTKTPTGAIASTPFVPNANAGVGAQIQTQQQSIENLSSQLGQPGSLP